MTVGVGLSVLQRLVHLGDKPHPFAREGANKALCFAIVAERAA